MRPPHAPGLALLPLLLVLGAPLARAQAPHDRLVGFWRYQDPVRTVTISFLPDGRYGAQITIGDTALSESGRYEVRATELTLAPRGADPVTYSFALSGTKLTLSGGNYETPLTYEKEPGSEQKVLTLARQADAVKAQEDATWRARLPVARLEPRAKHLPVGEIPADPNARHVFKNPFVFSAHNLYLRLRPYTVRFADGSARDVFNRTQWYFLPTGRVFIKMVRYAEGGRYDPTNPEGEVKTFWGAYRVEPGADVEPVIVESDEGETIEMELVDGRRNLYWGKEVYGQVDWENEALRRQGQPE